MSRDAYWKKKKMSLKYSDVHCVIETAPIIKEKKQASLKARVKKVKDFYFFLFLTEAIFI